MEEKTLGQMSFEEAVAALSEKMTDTEPEEAKAAAFILFMFNSIQL